MAKKPAVRVNDKGITILEVMIAIVILSLSLLLLLNMAMVALDGNDWSNKTTVATQMLQDKLEQLRGTQALSNGSDSTSGVTRSWTVTSAGHHLRQVTVQVNWHNIKGQTKSNTVTALIETDSI
jgi:Tfp pilus assembly protein PilV